MRRGVRVSPCILVVQLLEAAGGARATIFVTHCEEKTILVARARPVGHSLEVNSAREEEEEEEEGGEGGGGGSAAIATCSAIPCCAKGARVLLAEDNKALVGFFGERNPDDEDDDANDYVVQEG